MVPPALSISAITLSIEMIASRMYLLMPGATWINFLLEYRNKLLVGSLTPRLSMNSFPCLTVIWLFKIFFTTLSKTCTSFVYPWGKVINLNSPNRVWKALKSLQISANAIWSYPENKSSKNNTGNPAKYSLYSSADGGRLPSLIVTVFNLWAG